MLPRLKLWQALILSALSGWLLHFAFPGPSLWVLAPVSIFLIGWSLLRRSAWSSVLVGLVAGLTFWLSLIRWLTLYLGPIPWLALGILQAIFFALGIFCLSLVLNSRRNLFLTSWGKYVLVPITGGAVWATRELVTSNWPYGGFSWGLLAQSQSHSPFTALVAWIGTFAFSAIITILGLLAVQILRGDFNYKPMVATAIVMFLLISLPLPASQNVGSMKVLAVQGNSKSGLFDNRTSGDILNDHVNASLPFVGENVDVVVWPENAADIDPLTNKRASQILDYVSSEFSAPVVTGTVTQSTEGEYFNSSVVWTTGSGATAQFDKIHPVPFAEYMPDRAFWRTLQPDLVDLVGYDYTPGNRPNVVNIAGINVALAICFDITYEQQARKFINDGAQIVFAQTNNADFGRTDENVQQLAIARLRAVETGRSVVNISTVGKSAIILPNGEIAADIPAYQPGAMLEEVPLHNDITPAVYWGQYYELALLLIAIFGLTVALLKPHKP